MAQLLHEYEYVREFGEGVDRMYREIEEAGLPEPEYKTVAFMMHATIKNRSILWRMRRQSIKMSLKVSFKKKYEHLRANCSKSGRKQENR